MTGNYINYSVWTEVEWPITETTFTFGKCEVTAFPSEKEFDASLHLNLIGSELDVSEGMSILNQMLSIAAWLDDSYAMLHQGGAGSPVPIRQPRDTFSYPSSILHCWCNSWGPVQDVVSRRAIAIYREALNMYYFHSIPYAILGFYKIIEMKINGQQMVGYLKKEIDALILESSGRGDLFRDFSSKISSSPSDLAKFLKDDARHAVAHAAKADDINPDDVGQINTMSVAAELLRILARNFINIELGVSTYRWNQTSQDAEW